MLILPIDIMLYYPLAVIVTRLKCRYVPGNNAVHHLAYLVIVIPKSHSYCWIDCIPTFLSYILGINILVNYTLGNTVVMLMKI